MWSTVTFGDIYSPVKLHIKYSLELNYLHESGSQINLDEGNCSANYIWTNIPFGSNAINMYGIQIFQLFFFTERNDHNNCMP